MTLKIKEIYLDQKIEPYQKAARLIEYLQKQDASQKEIAQLLKISPSLLSKLKSKEYFPKNGMTLIQDLERYTDKKLLKTKLTELRFTNKKSNIKSILSTQKYLERAIIIALSIGICVLAYSLFMNNKLSNETSANQTVLTNFFIEETEEDIAKLINNLTLSSPTESQKKKIKKITHRFHSLNAVTKESKTYKSIDAVLNALNLLIVDRQPDQVFAVFEDLENMDSISLKNSMILTLTAFAHHANKENIEKAQSYSSKAEKYFEEATRMKEYTFVSAYNGLAVHKAMRAFFYLDRQERKEDAFKALREAEIHFKQASAMDDYWISNYKAINNITYIKARLLWFFLNEKITEEDLFKHFDADTVEELIRQIYEGCETAETDARGSSAAPYTTAECFSVIGQYYLMEKKNLQKAEEHFKTSKYNLQEAIELDVYEGKSKEEVREILLNEELLLPMLNSNRNNLDDILYIIN